MKFSKLRLAVKQAFSDVRQPGKNKENFWQKNLRLCRRGYGYVHRTPPLQPTKTQTWQRQMGDVHSSLGQAEYVRLPPAKCILSFIQDIMYTQVSCTCYIGGSRPGGSFPKGKLAPQADRLILLNMNHSSDLAELFQSLCSWAEMSAP